MKPIPKYPGLADRRQSARAREKKHRRAPASQTAVLPLAGLATSKTRSTVPLSPSGGWASYQRIDDSEKAGGLAKAGMGCSDGHPGRVALEITNECESAVDPLHERILTTHTGSLPRPGALLEALMAGQSARNSDHERLAAMTREAVNDIVARQVDAGVDLVNDGEMGKTSYATYIVERLSGFGGQGANPLVLRDAIDYPEWAAAGGYNRSDKIFAAPACVGEVAYVNSTPLEADLANLREATAEANPRGVFMSAASPGVIARFLENQYYDTHAAYVEALGAAMKTEYDTIYAAGVVLQLDCPDLAAGYHTRESGMSVGAWRNMVSHHVEVLNEATRDIPPESMRLHLCWGNYEGPHVHDVPLAEIIDIALAARPAALSFEAANPRHAHEWQLFEERKLPDGKTLVPGVVDSTTNYVEHPDLIAQRLENYARAVGRENIVAGCDCGFATFAGVTPVDTRVVFAKLQSLAAGAKIASANLWNRT